MQYIFFDPSNAFSPKNYPEKNQNVENYPRRALFFLGKNYFYKKKRTDNAVLEIGTNERGEIKEIDVQ
jgi:hypothetical protein